MKINLLYQGAFAERAAQKQKNFDPLAMAGQKITGTLNGKAFELTISDELVYMQNELEQLLLKDIHVQNADPNDIFSYRPKDQWLIFSQYLFDAGFFDEMSNGEMNEIESLLQQITDGLDSLTELGIDFYSRVKKPLDSYEAQLELISSTKALKMFSETFLDGEVKAGFDALIEQYWNHNEKKVRNYRSVEERFYEARAKLNLSSVSLSAKQAQMVRITNQLGKTHVSEESLNQLWERYSTLFEQLATEKDRSFIFQLVKEELLGFGTQNVTAKDKDAAKQWISDRVSETFNRTQTYWDKLFEFQSHAVVEI